MLVPLSWKVHCSAVTTLLVHKPRSSPLPPSVLSKALQPMKRRLWDASFGHETVGVPVAFAVVMIVVERHTIDEGDIVVVRAGYFILLRFDIAFNAKTHVERLSHPFPAARVGHAVDDFGVVIAVFETDAALGLVSELAIGNFDVVRTQLRFFCGAAPNVIPSRQPVTSKLRIRAPRCPPA
jgi:hypothetical protein